MIVKGLRRMRLAELVADGPFVAPRWAVHLGRVVASAALAAMVYRLAGFPWWAAWIPGALLVIAGRFVAVRWDGWRPIAARYIGPARDGSVAASIDFLRDEGIECVLALSLLGGLVPIALVGMPREVVRLVGLAAAVVALVRVYWMTCPYSDA